MRASCLLQSHREASLLITGQCFLQHSLTRDQGAFRSNLAPTMNHDKYEVAESMESP